MTWCSRSASTPGRSNYPRKSRHNISPWVLGFSQARAMHFAVGIGAVMAFLALLELWLMYEKAHPIDSPVTQKHQ